MAIERVSNLEFTMWTELRTAITQVIASGTYQRLVRIHADMKQDSDGFQYTRHRMHGMLSGPLGYRRFLPWHRAFLLIFERELRAINPNLSIPYWDWNADGGRMVGFSNLMGIATRRTVGTRLGETPVQGRVEWFANATQINDLISYPGDYYTFAKFLEDNPHNGGHGWIGGDMNSMASPSDPAFWFHHAQVDRIWALWQNQNQNEKAFLSGRESKLDPWSNEFDINNINDISSLGTDSYKYIEPTP